MVLFGVGNIVKYQSAVAKVKRVIDVPRKFFFLAHKQ